MLLRKWLLAVFSICWLIGCSSHPKDVNALFVRAQGVGASEAAARDQALKNAVERAFGLVLTSETALEGGRLKDEGIISLTSGVVQRSEVVRSEKLATGETRITLDALVSRAALASRYVDYFKGKSEQSIASDNLYYKAKSILENRDTSNRILSNLLAQYPKNTFLVKTGKAEIQVDTESKIILQLPIFIQWSEPYLLALREFVSSQASDECGNLHRRNHLCSSNLQIFVSGWNADSYTRFIFDDARFVKQLVDSYKQVIGLQVTLLDQSGRAIHEECFFANLSDNWGQSRNFPLVENNEVDSVYLGKHDLFVAASFNLTTPYLLKQIDSFKATIKPSC